jgi:hypothetical protein
VTKPSIVLEESKFHYPPGGAWVKLKSPTGFTGLTRFRSILSKTGMRNSSCRVLKSKLTLQLD